MNCYDVHFCGYMNTWIRANSIEDCRKIFVARCNVPAEMIDKIVQIYPDDEIYMND